MLKPFAFIAAILMSANAFAECPTVQTTEEVVRSIESNFNTRCGVIEREEPTIFSCMQDPTFTFSPDGQLKKKPAGGILMGVITSMIVEIRDINEIYPEISCPGKTFRFIDIQN